jgi:TonB-dependent SusC/RagA subfamily outer membrane receptor
VVCAASTASAQKRICIDHSDIERVEVLKGARAAQQYGTQAGEGVVIITMKIGNGGTPNFNCPPGQGSGDDPLARLLFPPELVMQNQQAIDLTERQRESIQELLKNVQGKFIESQFRMNGEMERLKQLIEASAVDEPKVLEQIDRILATERDVKRAQLSLMVKIKNQLSDQQKAALLKLRGDLTEQQKAELLKSQAGEGQPVSPPRGRGRPH